MKKLLLITSIPLIFLILINIFYMEKPINKNINLNLSKYRQVESSFNSAYKIETNSKEIDNYDEIKELSEKTTYLLLGNENESSKTYYLRHKEYKELKYSTDGNDLVPDISVDGMFLSLNEMNIKYSSITNMDITKSNNYYISTLTLPDVTYKGISPNETKFIEEKSNLILTYFFKEKDESFYLYYISAKLVDDLNTYDDTAFAIKEDVNLSNIYDYGKYDELNTSTINHIYNSISSSIITLNAYNTNELVSSSLGVLVSPGIVLTNYDFIEKSLLNASFISANNYKIDGIITLSKENNLALLKLETNNTSSVSIGKTPNIEDPVVTIKLSNNNLVTNKSLIIDNFNYLKTAEEDNSSEILLSTDSKLLGISTNNDESIYKKYINTNIISNTIDKLNNKDFTSIEVTSFEKLKEDFYQNKKNKAKEVKLQNNIKNLDIIKTINNNINIPLVKSSKDNNIISLRYENKINKYMSNEDISLDLRNHLLNNNYKEVSATNNKYIYENEYNKIIIINEFDYLIVIVVIK